jgi:OmpA-OmpF porin, OOP family
VGKAAVFLGLAVLGLMSTQARAQQTPGWYIGAQVGWTGLRDASSSFTSGGVTLPFTTSSSGGIGGGFTAGFEWPFGMRLEGEATLRRNDYSTFTTPIMAGSFALSGNTVSMALMVNALYDFLPHSRWTPYLGAGIGIASFGIDNIGPTALGIPGTSDTLWQFAYQGIAGIKFAWTPQVSIDLNYSYFAMPNATFNTSSTTQLKSQYGSNNVMLGIAYHLGAPPHRSPTQPGG